ncbi:MAG: tetratricopeptide repeat protein [Gemmatimonadetes bacterium]|nr:tetratricopeptide repeat protein [Gemmatimonadota bacterium]
MRVLVLLLTTALATVPLRAQAPGTTRWADSLAVLIEAAVERGDPAAFGPAIALADRVLTVTPADGAILHYKGYALYRQATLLINAANRPDDAGKVLEEAADLFTRSAAILPWPETPALHASVLGQQIALGGVIAGMRLGGRADDLFAQAIRLGPDNPRVLMLRGISALFKPRMFGGGSDKARADFQRAVDLFPKQAPAPGAPRWGHAEAWAWLGQAHAAEKDPAAARVAYARAMELHPDYAWVRDQLLPALDKVKR